MSVGRYSRDNGWCSVEEFAVSLWSLFTIDLRFQAGGRCFFVDVDVRQCVCVCRTESAPAYALYGSEREGICAFAVFGGAAADNFHEVFNSRDNDMNDRSRGVCMHMERLLVSVELQFMVGVLF